MRRRYKFFDEHKVVVLALAYPKTVQEDNSAEETTRIRQGGEEMEKERARSLRR